MIRRSIAATALIAGLFLAVPPSRADFVLVPETGSPVNVPPSDGTDVLRVDTMTGASSIFSNDTTALDAPLGITIGNGGNVYVSNIGTKPALIDSVVYFPPSGGAHLGGFGQATLTYPQGVTTDSSGNVYVGNYASGTPTPATSDTIEKFSPTGTHLATFATLPANSDPFGLLFDKNGNLYVTDNVANTIREYNSSGTLIATSNATVNAALGGPAGIAFDANGNLLVTNTTNNTIVQVNPGLTSVSTFFANPAVLPPNTKGLYSPIGIVFDPSTNDYLVSNYANTDGVNPGGVVLGWIEKFSTTGQDLGTLINGLNGPGFLVIQSVPEPGTMTLLGIGLVGLIGYGWRQKRSARAA